jgi:hypothetical protein
MTTGNVDEECAVRRRRRWQGDGFAAPFGGGKASGKQTDSGRLDVTLATGDLAGEPPALIRLESQYLVEQDRRIEERIAVKAAQPRELRVFQTWNGAEDAHLFGVFQLGLETNHIEQRAEFVVLAQLHHGVGLVVRLVRIGEPKWFHRAMTQSLNAAFRHDFDWQAAIEVGCIRLPFMEARLVAGEQRRNEGVILLTWQRAVDVVGARAARAGFVVAGLKPGLTEIDAVAMDNWRDGVEKRELLLARQAGNRGGAAVTAAENPSRSTARAPPAGT